ncbi:MAG: hypothetical protein QOH83_1871, partial [Solirubrobacteraceae bacterium]|nr:hypothetical protein [Solirubrobacteraceae bacterium]
MGAAQERVVASAVSLTGSEAMNARHGRARRGLAGTATAAGRDDRTPGSAQPVSNMQTIGFIGLGHMGANMAGRFLAAGYAVYGESRTREHAQWLVDQGLRWLDTPREVAEAADVVLTSLPDDDAVKSVASGADGILAGLDTGKLWADLSTISPSASRELAARVRGRGAQMLDAPVSGSVPQVQAGTLTIMVGGDE